MTDHDRELGTIVTRLTEIERRLAEGDKDMRELTRTVTELVKAMAGLTARLSLAAGGVHGASPAIPATGAAAAGGIVGAAVGAKLASWLGLG
ncbi:MAG: hypothetical protein ACK4PG_08145 [Acetobacteraceae bacterium]